jgi:hypothetical protein
MQDEPTSEAIDEQDQVEHAVFILLTAGEEQRPWAVREIELEIGDPIGVADSLAHLHRGGLIHRCGEFVWATRAALRADQLAL